VASPRGRLAPGNVESARLACRGRVGNAGTVSPLTPVLAPLRGEGDAMETFASSHDSGRERPCPPAGGDHPSAARCAETMPLMRTVVRRAPSPLNGERAGGRGENCVRRPLSTLMWFLRTLFSFRLSNTPPAPSGGQSTARLAQSCRTRRRARCRAWRDGRFPARAPSRSRRRHTRSRPACR